MKTIIDLRANEELEADPPAELPVEVLHIPFFETDTSEWKEIEAELESAARAAPDVPTATREVYLIFLEHFGRNVATAIRAVADAPEGGVVIHCAGGKDRTGLLTALLLHVAGVGIEEIAADYALSEERLRPRHEQWFAEAESDEELRTHAEDGADAGRVDRGRLRRAREAPRQCRGLPARHRPDRRRARPRASAVA